MKPALRHGGLPALQPSTAMAERRLASSTSHSTLSVPGERAASSGSK
jgi:hypothetical protein